MRALTIVDGDLVIDELPVPHPGAGEVVVRVHGAGLNRADLLQRAGRYPSPPGVAANVPGLEFAGVVEAVGAGVEAPRVGDRVFGLVAAGAHAEYVVVHASHCAAVPPELDLVEMGGVPEAFITAHDAMVTQARVQPGEWVLVHAIGSGVGTAALQLAKALDARVVGTARTPTKLERCRELGLDAGFAATTTADGALDVDALAWSIVEATGEGAHVTLDLAGGDYVAVDVNAAAAIGRIVLIGMMAGPRTTLPVAAVLAKRLTIVGTLLRPRNVEAKAQATDAFARDVVPLVANGRIRPVVDAVIRLTDAASAYQRLASDATFGKLVLDCR